MSKFTRIRLVIVFALITVAVVFAAVKFGPASQAQRGDAKASSPEAVGITATLTDNVTAATKVAPGGQINYSAVITNGGTDAATGVIFNDTLDPTTTLMGGSIQISPVAFDDTYGTGRNVQLSIPNPGLLTNDYLGSNPAGTVTAFSASSTQCVACNNVVVSASGSFTYTPPNNFTGTDTFTYTLSNAAAGSIGTVTITVIDPPVANPDGLGASKYATPVGQQFGRGAPGVLGNDTLNGGTIASYGASTGNEQTTIGSSTPTAQGGSITLNANGSFTLTPPGAGFSGNDTFKYRLSNAGGSSTATVTIYVDVLPTVLSTTPVNGATGTNIHTPAPITINFSEPITTSAAFSISPSVAFTQSPTDGNTASTFTLTPTADLAPGQLYTVTVSHFQTADADGGLSMQADYVFSFTTLPLPIAVNDPDTQGGRYAVTANMPIDTALGTPSSIFDNDTLNSTSSVTYGATGPTANVAVNGTNTITTSNGGTVLMRVNGTFTYSPAPGFTGNDNFFYKLTNASGTSQAQVLLTVSGPVIWFVNPAAATNGTGTLANPFNVLSSAITAIGVNTGQRIFIYSGGGAQTGNFVLRANTLLVGQAAVGAPGSFDALMGVTPSAYTINARPALNSAGAKPVITGSGGNTITLGDANTILGVAIANTGGGFAVTGTSIATGTIGNATTSDVTIGSSGTSSGAVSLTGAATGSIPINAPITTTAGHSVTISNRTGGTVSFNQLVNDTGTGVTLTSNTGATINFTNGLTASTSASTAFSATGGGTVSVTGASNTLTTTTATALNVANTTIGASGLTFLSINAPTASGNPGIVLNTTGTGALSVTGTGTTAGSGGTISNKSGNGVTFTSASNISLKNMNLTTNSTSNGNATTVNCGVTGPANSNSTCTANANLNGVTGITFDNVLISGSAQNGINGLDVSNLKILNSTVQNNGNESGENGVFIQNLTGLTSALTNSTFSNNNVQQFGFVNFTSGALGTAASPFNVSGCTFIGKGNTVTPGGDGFQGRIGGTSTAYVSVGGGANAPSHFQKNYSYGVFLDAVSSGNATFIVNGCDFGAGGAANYNNSGIAAGISGAAVVNYTFTNNTVTGVAFGTPGNGVGIIATTGLTTAGASIIGTVTGNSIGEAAVAGSGGFNNAAAMQLLANGGGPMVFKATVNGNTIRNTTSFGIQYIGGTTTGAVTGTLHINSNTLSGGSPNAQAISVAACASGTGGAVSTLGANIGNQGANVITGSWDGANGDSIRVTTLRGSQFTVGGLASNPNATPAQVVAYLATVNNVTGGNGNALITASNTASGGGTFIGTGAAVPFAPPTELGTESASIEMAPANVETPSALGEMGSVESGQLGETASGENVLAVGQTIIPGRQSIKACGDIILACGENIKASGDDMLALGNYIEASRIVEMPSRLGAEANGDTVLTAATTEHGPSAYDIVAEIAERAVSQVSPTVYSQERISTRKAGRSPESGETITESIGTLPAGKSVTIKFTATVNDPTAASSASTQGTVSGGNFANVLTDDPDAPGATDPTVTRVQQPPTVSNIIPGVNEDTVLAFTAATFDAGFSDPNNNIPAGNPETLQILRITSLPTHGLLKISGAAFTVPQDIVRANIGTLTYTPNANFNGSDSFGWNGSDGTVFAAAPALANISITSVNDAPVVSGDGTESAITINEDTPGAGQTVNTLFAGQYSDQADNQIPNGGASSPGAFSGVAVTANGSTAATGQWQYLNGAVWTDIGGVSDATARLIANTAFIRFNPAADSSGTAPTLTIHLIDNSLGFGITNGQVVDISGAGTGGATAYSTGTVVLSQDVTSSNDAPSFTKGSDQTISEDAAAQTINGWATVISAGAANESGQALNFIVTNNHNGLFTVQPSVAANGTLTYTLAANANGPVIVSVSLHDDGGTANSGVDTSAVQTFNINITAINDAPVVVGDGTESAATINEDTPGAGQSISAIFAGQYSDAADNQIPNGGASSPGAFAGVAVTANGSTAGMGQWQYFNGTAWVNIGPASDAAAVLISNDAVTKVRFNPAANFSGPAPSMTVHLIDNSLGFGITNGQVVNISAVGATGGTTAYSTGTVVLSQDVNAVNDVPTFVKGANQSVQQNSPAQTVSGWATAISSGPADEAGQALNFIVNNNNNALFSVQPAVAANGTLTYTPAPGQNGTAIVSVSLHDDGGILNGGVDTSAVQTFTITLFVPCVSANAASTTADSGPGSLRDAIANTCTGGTISLNIPGGGDHIIQLLSPLPPIDRDLTINGPTNSSVTLKGQFSTGPRPEGTVAFPILTIRGASAPTMSEMAPTAANVSISNLNITGGAALPGVCGGGIVNDHATLTLTNVTIYGNSASQGAGICNLGAGPGTTAVLNLVNSTISSNTATGEGGGISNQGQNAGNAILNITNSTIAGNSATGGAGVSNYGFNGGNGVTNFRNTILSNGTTGGNLNSSTAAGTGGIVSLGYNLSDDAAGGDAATGPGGFLNVAGDLRNSNAALGPLAFNGGPTQTHLLLSGSRAIDQGSFVAGLTTDQRGVTRPIEFSGITNAPGGDGSDIGALEMQALTVGEVSLSGRVLTPEGRGITNAVVTISGGSLATPVTVVTGRAGRYTLVGLTAGETYVVTVASRRFVFDEAARVVTLNDNLTGLDFIGGAIR